MHLGIKPTFPNTGFGYIELTRQRCTLKKMCDILWEKPDYESAKDFLINKEIFMNAGIFMWSVKYHS